MAVEPIEDMVIKLGLRSRMQVAEIELFDLLPVGAQDAYVRYWQTRPDRHASHRDTLPAFVAGLFSGLG